MSTNPKSSQKPVKGLLFTGIGALVNILLSAVKILVGWWGNSRALMADGIHSLSDLCTDIVVGLGLFYGSRPYDECHPYGHKKIETLSEVATGVLLVGFAGIMVFASGQALKAGDILEPSSWVLLIALVSVVSKEWLYRKTLSVGRRTGSMALVANAWHHRSDALTSLATLGAVGLAKVHPSLRLLDPLACIGISLLVGKIGFSVSYRALRRLVDTAPEPIIIERIRTVTMGNPQVRGLHKLRARYLGGQIIADLHIQVDPELTVMEGHSIASEVEKAIAAELGNIYDVTVHVEPMLTRMENKS